MSRNFLLIISISLSISVNAQTETSFKNTLLKHLAGQQTKSDSIIVKKYLNDTLSFTMFPDKMNLDSIVPNLTTKYWELNSFTNLKEYFDTITMDFRYVAEYTNHYRSTKESSVKDDSIVLTKTNEGFGTTCPPGWCNWYISVKYSNGQSQSVTDWKKLSYFLGKIDNPLEAYFWARRFIYSDSELPPPYINEGSRYKKVNNGYLVVVQARVSDCPGTTADMMYFVHQNQRIVFIQLLNLRKTGGCI